MAPSSSGQGRLVFSQKITGSNPVGATKVMIEQESEEEYEETNKELQPWLKKAQDIIRKNNLLGRLDITHKNDSSLFISYLATRLLRAKIYDKTKLLNPFSSETIKARILRSQSQESALVYEASVAHELLNILDESTSDLVDEFYVTMEEKDRARAIELAVNNLCAEALVFDDRRVISEFKPSRKILNAWAETWKDKIMQHNNPVRKA